MHTSLHTSFNGSFSGAVNHAFTSGYPTSLSVAAKKHCDRKQLREERVYLLCTL